MVDEVRSHLRSLETLGQPVQHWGTLVVYLIANKLDNQTREEWEKYMIEREEDEEEEVDSIIDDFLNFLERRGKTSEMVERNKTKADSSVDSRPSGSKGGERKVLLTAAVVECGYCQKQHPIYKCDAFLKMTASERLTEVFKRKLCANCLKPGHIGKNCRMPNCRTCNHKHNALLHGGRFTKIDDNSPAVNGQAVNGQAVNGGNPGQQQSTSGISGEHRTQSLATHCAPQGNTNIILSTAQVYIRDRNGHLQRGRALLDSGAQSNLITEEFADRLQIPIKDNRIPMSTVSKTRLIIRKSVDVELSSTISRFMARETCLVLPAITDELPQTPLDKERINIPHGIEMADPEFGIPGPIDLLIGAGLYWRLLKHGEVIARTNQPVLQNSELGWIIGGELKLNCRKTDQASVNLLAVTRLEQQIERFWLTEEVEDKRPKSTDAQVCEMQFKNTYTRDKFGRFKVELPQRSDIVLGQSFDAAMKRLKSIEKRFERQPDLKRQYVEFLRDYQAAGHMSLSSKNSEPRDEEFYIPHQPVLRSTSLTTKLRVVFDASAKTTNGNALNDKLMSGPNLQNDLFDILLRFRTHEYVITADIAQMFRQVMVAEKDRPLQQILWRESSEGPVDIYTLNTVTYGTSCAPYLAMRCLRELVAVERTAYPTAAAVLERDFYMDDLLSGMDTIQEAAELQKQLMELLAKGQFRLRKWRSNDVAVLSDLETCGETDGLLVLCGQGAIKTLGLMWDSKQDTLQYEIQIPERMITKRNILSAIASIYDPLGLIGPVVMYAKCIMQELWKLKLGWDSEVTADIGSSWRSLIDSLQHVKSLMIPRNVNAGNSLRTMTIHGFSDASDKGYGACIYGVSYDQNNQLQVNLVCAKSRVAPLKMIDAIQNPVTTPRLELSAALLLAKLLAVVKRALGPKVVDVHLWSDSTIVLHWISKPVHSLKIFEANRVAVIQELTQGVAWRHVPTKDNPADILSRGALAHKLAESDLWWHGPLWLPNMSEWPPQNIPAVNVGMKTSSVVAVATESSHEVLRRFSNFSRLLRVVAYCYRFIRNLKQEKLYGPLTVGGLEKARIRILHWTQQEVFGPEIEDLRDGGCVDSKSSLAPLKPFLDEMGLIRVGGRLRNANIPEDHKYPVMLPAKHHATTLIMRAKHEELLHCGPNHLLSAVRCNYWPLSGPREARRITKSCLACRRFKPQIPNYIMGDLPRTRVEELTRPFEVCGVDYAGPLQVRESKRRGRLPVIAKAYVAVFICFATKAIHLEFVSDLTTEAFLAALRRFVARRGLCRIINSDNGTNFVGASRELETVYKFLIAHEAEIAENLTSRRIIWKFIPARSPHHGGLWEAAVRSVKKHLYTVTRGLIRTFEEYSTLLTEIESVLNSRPLLPLSADPSDLSYLTPSHFLLGCSTLEPVSKSFLGVPDTHLSRWQHLQKVKQDFWKRWKHEYLHHLQTRTKWSQDGVGVKVGDLVLLVDENQPPLSWSMGRVVGIHPGQDGVVRVVDVRTRQGVYTRSVKKLCALPIESVDCNVSE